MENNVTPNSGQGTPVNERDSSFGSNIRGFNEAGGNNKGYKDASQFSFDKSFGPGAPSLDDAGITDASNFDGHHIKVESAQSNNPGIQPSSSFSFDKNFGTAFNGTEGEAGLSAGMDTDKGGIINK